MWKNKHKHHVEATKLFHCVQITLHSLCPQTFNNAKKYCDTCCSSWRTKSKYLRSGGGDTFKFASKGSELRKQRWFFDSGLGVFQVTYTLPSSNSKAKGVDVHSLWSQCVIFTLKSCAAPQQFSRFIVIYPLWRQRPGIMMGFVSSTPRGLLFFFPQVVMLFFLFFCLPLQSPPPPPSIFLTCLLSDTDWGDACSGGDMAELMDLSQASERQRSPA